MFRQKTNKGRVVYERKKHEFTMRDIERIWKKVSKTRKSPDENREFFDDLMSLLIEMVRFLGENPNIAVSVSVLLSVAMVIDNLVDFCKGNIEDRIESGFGGAGASRTF